MYDDTRVEFDIIDLKGQVSKYNRTEGNYNNVTGWIWDYLHGDYYNVPSWLREDFDLIYGQGFNSGLGEGSGDLTYELYREYLDWFFSSNPADKNKIPELYREFMAVIYNHGYEDGLDYIDPYPNGGYTAGFQAGYQKAKSDYEKYGNVGFFSDLSGFVKSLGDVLFHVLDIEIMGYSILEVAGGIITIFILAWLLKVVLGHGT